MNWQCILLVILVQTFIKDVTSKEVTIQVNPKRLVQYVPERFLSMTVDPGSILLAGELKNEALNMARALSPCFVRLGGKSTNYIKFGKELFTDNTTISEEQWDSVNRFARDAGLDLIVSVNPTQRINGVWDSRDALELISYSEKQGYNVAWQLGYDTEGISAPGAEVGRDVVRLRKILDGFSKFTRSPIFAPDFPEIATPKEAQFVRDLLIQAGPILGAIFIQPRFKPEEDPAHSIMNTVVNLDSNVWGKALRLGRIIPRKPIWIAEREISKGSAEDAINLAKRLGVSAKIGVQVVMRQVGPDTLRKPTPEFWMALLFKNLVGRGVLDARINSGLNRTELQIFSHCTQSMPADRSIIDAGMLYDKGAVTVYGVNEGHESIKISLRAGMKEERVHVYSLTFSDDPTRSSEVTYLNGQELTLSPLGELPLVSPRVVRRPSKSGVIIPGRSVFFFVLPDVKSRVCSSGPIVPHEVQELSRKLIQVAAEVLDKPVNSINIPGEEEETGKLYVKFGKNSRTNNIPNNPNPWSQIKDSTNTVGEITTVSTPVNGSENSTAASDPARRKRSAESDNSYSDLEAAATTHIDQKELVKYLNHFSHQVYELSQKNGDGKQQVYYLPKEILDTMKKAKLTFKPSGITTEDKDTNYEVNTINPSTSGEYDTDDEVTTIPVVPADEESSETYDVTPSEVTNEKPKVDSVLDEGDAPINELDYNELELNQKRVEKEAVSDDNKGLDGNNIKEDDTFRGTDKETTDDSPKGKVPFPDDDSRSEVVNAIVSSSSAEDKSEDEVSGDELNGQSKSAIETSSPGRVTSKDAKVDNDLGSETVDADESTEDVGDAGRKETTSYGVSSSGTPSTSQTASEEDTPEVTKGTEKTYEPTKPQELIVVPESESEPVDEKDKNLIEKVVSTTELPGAVSIEGVDRRTLDAMLLQMAKTSDGDNKATKDIIKDDEFTEIEKTKLTDSKLKTDDKTGSMEQEAVDNLKKQTSQSESEKVTENESEEDEDKTVESDDGSEMNTKNQEEQDETANELSSGPSIPSSNSVDSVKTKTPREIPATFKSGSVMENKPVVLLLDPTAKLPESNENYKDVKDEKNLSGDVSNKLESDDSKIIKEDESTLVESNNSGEMNPLAVVSFKDVPLEKGEDKSYNPKLKMTGTVIDNEENNGGSSEEEDEKSSMITVPVVMQMPTSLMSTQTPDENSEVASGLDDVEKDDDKESTTKSTKKAEDSSKRLKLLKEREEKWLAIRNKILETRERFKALAKDDNWKSTLQQREEEIRNLLSQEKEQRKKLLALARPGSETLLSRPRRLTYYPEDEMSSEDMYDYEPEDIYSKRPDSYGTSLNLNQGKLPLGQDLYQNALKQDQNHIIFPLDPKTPQAVVYNNKIIPAKLYGVINLCDTANSNSRIETLKPPTEQTDSFFQKYFTKSYDPPRKFSSVATPAPTLKSIEINPSPKDLYLRRLDDSSNFLPVVVLPHDTTRFRKRRSLPHVSYNKHPEKNNDDTIIEKHSVKKRSILPKDNIRTKNSVTEIPKETATEIISNEIKPENYNEIKPSKLFSDTQFMNDDSFVNDRYGTIEIGPWSEPIKLSDARTFDLLPSLLTPPHNLLPRPQLPPTPNLFQQRLPPLHRALPPEPLQQGPQQNIFHEQSQPQRILPSEQQQPLENLNSGPLPPPPQEFPPQLIPQFQDGMFPEPIPNVQRTFPQEFGPIQQDFSGFSTPFMSTPEAPRQEKQAPESKAYFMTMLQDKFRSLMGMLDTLAVWCGANASK